MLKLLQQSQLIVIFSIFRVEILKCKICKVSFSYDQQKSGTNSLRRHLATKHSKALKAKDSAGKSDESQGSLVESGFVSVTKRPKLELSPKTCCILTLACSRHVLPLQFFKDLVVSNGFNLPVISRREVREKVFSLSEEIKESAFESLNNQWATIVLDGWKNPVTGNHHLSFLMFQVGKENNRPIFLKSIVMSTISANDIQGQIQVIIDDLKKNNITPIACVSDNAPSMIRAVEDIFSRNPSVLPVRCSAHVLNLVIKDLLKKVDFLKNAFAILLDYISKNYLAAIVKRDGIALSTVS